jgi:ATP-dependent Lon protease
MPGQIIQCLKATGSFNAVCLIDEIDKLNTGFRGDPASALLEVLDPSQNSTFRDHYIDFPVDISKILFICTANEVERIPGPLLDRMDVIRLSGYDFPEKITIAEKYLVPKAMRDNGLMVDPASLSMSPSSNSDSNGEDLTADSSNTESISNPTEKQPTPFDQYVPAEGVPSTLSITTEAITSLVRWYAREAGVRNLAKYIDKITRKLALQIVAETEGTNLTDKEKRKTDAWVIDDKNLAEYVGIPRFTSDRLYETGPLPSGIVMGLAYTSMGGATLYIETQGIKRGLDENGKKLVN